MIKNRSNRWRDESSNLSFTIRFIMASRSYKVYYQDCHTNNTSDGSILIKGLQITIDVKGILYKHQWCWVLSKYAFNMWNVNMYSIMSKPCRFIYYLSDVTAFSKYPNTLRTFSELLIRDGDVVYWYWTTRHIPTSCDVCSATRACI